MKLLIEHLVPLANSISKEIHMKKLNTFALYALVAPALTLGAGSVLAQYSGDLDSGRLQQSSQVSQDATSKAGNDRQRDQSRTQHRSYLDAVPANGMHASNLIGTTVHISDDDDIGSVDDLIIDKDGQVVAIIVGVGGFLGIGEKDVAIGWENVTKTGNADKLKLRVDVTREKLDAAPEFSDRDQSRTDRSNQRDQNTQQHAQQSSQQSSEQGSQHREQKSDVRGASNQRTTANQSRMQSHGHIDSVPANGSQASKLIGMDVHTNDNEDIGSVDDLVIDENGQVVAIIVSVGGFLGIGQKDVAIGWGNVTRSGSPDDQELRADVTRDALNSAPKFANRN